jgi:hypothetical protein
MIKIMKIFLCKPKCLFGHIPNMRNLIYKNKNNYISYNMIDNKEGKKIK